ncbi:hypothetical protein KC669_04305, partial [Candidatus Dojkabacteria bacterium]|nr:hypothetical protein [Candidatus Dojkabacteria bacterium]
VPEENIISQMVLDSREVKSIIKVDVNGALDVILDKRTDVTATVTDLNEEKKIKLTESHFRNFTDDNLYLKIMLAAKHYLEGENHEYIVI